MNHVPCLNLAALQLERGTPSTQIMASILGEFYPLDETFSTYYWDAPSTATHNPPEVIHPIDLDTMALDVRAGRWTKVDLENTAPAQVNADWAASSGLSQVLNKPSLAAVAVSGSYDDLSNKPSIPSAQVQSDWTSGSGPSHILNKPSLSTVATSGSYADLSNKPTITAIQRTRVQTNATGDYTWTYPVPFGTGVVPVISALSETASSTVPQGIQIVGTPTNTSVTIKVINLPSTNVLGILVLGAPTGSQAYVHLTAVAP